MIVDDHEIVCHGLRLSLELEGDMVVVGEARTGADAVRIAADLRPDVMLLDVRLEDIDGPEVCRRVREIVPETAVLILTSYIDDRTVLRSMLAGARGYVVKDVELARLKTMIRSVHRGSAVLDPRVSAPVLALPAVDGAPAAPGFRRVTLSETDLTIIRGLASGLTNKQLAVLVDRSPHTIKHRLERIGCALDSGCRTHIVAEALRRGLI